MRIVPSLTAALILWCTGSFLPAQTWQSSILYPDQAGRLVYVSDSLGNHVPNWASAGYHNGDLALPDLPNVDSIAPIPGDNRAHLQAALDAVAALPPDANGHRGALFLQAGTYPFAGTLYLDASGVVLRGAGDGTDPNSNTILLSTDTNQIDILVAGHGTYWKRWRDSIPGTKQNIVSEVLPMSTHWIELADASAYPVGAPVVIYHPSTTPWLATVNFGDTGSDAPWAAGQIDLVYRRKVRAVSGNFIQLDAPLPHPMRRALSQAYVYVHDSTTLNREFGIESLRVDCQYTGPTDEAHAYNAICFYEAEDAWVRGVTVTHFVRGGFVFQTASNITVEDCRSLDPISIITGSRRYNFDAESACTNLLFQRCHATEGRHAFVSNGPASSSGIVFTASSSLGDWTSSEGHRQWAHGLLFDSLSILQPNTSSSNPVFDRVLGLYNRGDYGTAHGWGSAHSVIWNCSSEDAYFVVEQPPSAQNYAFACRISNGSVLGSGPFNQAPGWIEGSGQVPAIGSLYRAQREQKALYGPAPDPAADLQVRDTTLGIFLNWYDNDQAESGYRIERSSDGQNYLPIATLPANTTTYTDTLLQSGVFWYRVQTFNAVTIAPYSNWGRDTFDYVVGREMEQAGQPRVYPNPGGAEVRLDPGRLADHPELKITWHDLLGRTVNVEQSAGFRFQTGKLAPGLYFIHLCSHSQSHTLRLEILH